MRLRASEFKRGRAVRIVVDDIHLVPPPVPVVDPDSGARPQRPQVCGGEVLVETAELVWIADHPGIQLRCRVPHRAVDDEVDFAAAPLNGLFRGA